MQQEAHRWFSIHLSWNRTLLLKSDLPPVEYKAVIWLKSNIWIFTHGAESKSIILSLTGLVLMENGCTCNNGQIYHLQYSFACVSLCGGRWWGLQITCVNVIVTFVFHLLCHRLFRFLMFFLFYELSFTFFTVVLACTILEKWVIFCLKIKRKKLLSVF